MNTYYLQQGGRPERYMIDTKVHGDFEIAEGVDPVNAGCWIAAKQAFGFELTPLQRLMLSIRPEADPVESTTDEEVSA